MSLTFFIKKFSYLKDLNTPYRMMRLKCLKNVLNTIDKKKYKQIQLFNCLLTYLINRRYNITWVNISFRNRKYGNSKFNFSRMLSMFLNFILKV